MTSNYVVLAWKRVLNACVVKEFTGVKDDFELNEGVPRAEGFSSKAAFRMDPDRPHDTLLTDNLKNTKSLVVGSRRLKEFLESRHVPEVEYLPVTIIDHKRRPASRDYFIINPIHPVDCLVVDKCGVRRSSVDEDTILGVEHLVIDESKVDPERQLFRAKSFYVPTLVRRDLAESITNEGFTAVRWIELNAYPEI